MDDTTVAFKLLRAALTSEGVEVGPLDTNRWWRLFRLMQRNHVVALVADTMATLDVPREVKIPWLAERDKAARWYRYQLEVQQDITDHMARHGIETLVLKGTHTAQYYPQPELREFGDLDLYFFDRHTEADKVAQSELGIIPDNGTHHHSKYDYRGITVESHYDFLNTHYPRSNKRYNQMLKQLAPSATFEVLYLLRHMAIHFAAARITLRDLVDWTLTCHTLQDNVDWEIVLSTINEYGMEHFASALNDISARQLGYAPPLRLAHNTATTASIEHDIVFGCPNTDSDDDMSGRLKAAIRHWHTLRWKRRLVYNDSAIGLMFGKLDSHLNKTLK